MQSKKVPLRMCLVCRQHLPKQDLIRVVKNKEGKIMIDKTFKADGRGAYICKNEQCMLKLIKNRGLNRAFKCEISNEIYNQIKGELETFD